MNLNLPEKREFVGPAMMWKRILAFVLDLFILDFFVLGAFGTVAEKMLGTTDIFVLTALAGQDSSMVRGLSMLAMLMVTIALMYFALLQYAAGQTIGGILFNLHVLEQTGEKEFRRAGFWQCVLRNAFMIPAVPFIFLWVIDPLYLVFTKKGQRLTEWLSNTRVVEKYTF